jgi:16S rRNA (uracil1498-N3)-methyltransferase
MAHLFCIHYPPAREVSPSAQEVVITDRTTIHRITRILRLSENDTVILFSDGVKLYGTIAPQHNTKNHLLILITKRLVEKPLAPRLHLGCGLTKKAAWETIVYHATQLGVTSITPLLTAQTHNPKWYAQYQKRVEQIGYAACEQSKQIIPVTLHEPQSLDSWAGQTPNRNRYFLEHGYQPLIPQLHATKPDNADEFFIVIGPEGGLLPQEQQTLIASGFSGASIAPTILQSCDAVALGAGIVRSFFMHSVL